MPGPQVKAFAKKSGKSVSDVEKIWKSTKDDLLKSRKEDDPSFFPILVTIVKKKLKIEGILTFKEFNKKE